MCLERPTLLYARKPMFRAYGDRLAVELEQKQKAQREADSMVARLERRLQSADAELQWQRANVASLCREERRHVVGRT
jgi:hypothetical protein